MKLIILCGGTEKGVEDCYRCNKKNCYVRKWILENTHVPLTAWLK